ncbi:hypothetical protein ANRL1_03718 [Anaerolineae bacterium]|nr:hypothetical protein ANRL1_03718 [Anaerolineae bacterium]
MQKTLELIARLCYTGRVITQGQTRIRRMEREAWNSAEWVSLTQAAALLRRAHKPRHPQSLYGRIRRGTLAGTQHDGKWFIPANQMQRLLQEPYRRKGGRPTIKDTPTFIAHAPRRRLEIPDVAEVARLVTLPIEKRAKLTIRSHVLTRNLIRARLETQYPKLSRREISLKVVQELSRHG